MEIRIEGCKTSHHYFFFGGFGYVTFCRFLFITMKGLLCFADDGWVKTHKATVDESLVKL